MSWQKTLAQGFHSIQELLAYLQLPASLGDVVAEKQFKTRLTRRFAHQMEPGNPRDPLLLQVLASQQERVSPAHFSTDPLQEKQTNLLPGLIKKYHGRVLLLPAPVCAIHCRYCFRRHFPYTENHLSPKQWQAIFDYLMQHDDIHEVILSGGDPLLMSDVRLRTLLMHLAAIPHIQTIRFHTRVPIVLPERITTAWLRACHVDRFHYVMVLHCNHPNEITSELATVCQQLRSNGFHLLNQTVLLRGVNHDSGTLIQLNKRLFTLGVLPYYLHLLDPVQSAAHFDVPQEEASILYEQLQTHLPGYLVPKLVKEEFGHAHKTLVLR